MIKTSPQLLEGHGVRLEPLMQEHAEALALAAADGALWNLWFTGIPKPEETRSYIDHALSQQEAGRMLPWVVRESATGTIVGSTRFHDIVAEIDRVEIGYTWYAKRWQKSHVNTGCKLLLMTYAFERLGCKVVALRTDRFNYNSQKAIEALGARKDGILRHFATRRDGSSRDIVMYSILASEWPEVKLNLEQRLMRHGEH